MAKSKPIEHIGLKLDGKPFEPNSRPSCATIANFLRGSPADEVYTTRELARRFKVSETAVLRVAREFSGLSVRYKGGLIYGSRRAIEELRRQLET
jgi:hypothetical protein